MSSALTILLPSEVSDALKKVVGDGSHDGSHGGRKLLPPHIDFFHPFLSDHTAKKLMARVGENISRELTFDLELKNFTPFTHADGVAIHLGVRMLGKAGEMVRAEKFLSKVAHQLKVVEKKPFVLVTNVADQKTAATLIEEFEKKWTPIKFTVTGLSWLARGAKDVEETKEVKVKKFLLKKFFPLLSAAKHKEDEAKAWTKKFRSVMEKYQVIMLSCASRCAEYKSTESLPCPFAPEEMFPQTSAETMPNMIYMRLMDKIIELFHTGRQSRCGLPWKSSAP